MSYLYMPYLETSEIYRLYMEFDSNEHILKIYTYFIYTTFVSSNKYRNNRFRLHYIVMRLNTVLLIASTTYIIEIINLAKIL